jgi:hypothetical protein
MKYIACLIAAALLFAAPAAYADPTKGPQVAQETVAAGGTVEYTVEFNGDELANVDLFGACNAYQDIDLWVYDEHRNLVAKSVSAGCYEAVEWTPVWTGPFSVVVENTGKPLSTDFYIEAY